MESNGRRGGQLEGCANPIRQVSKRASQAVWPEELERRMFKLGGAGI